MQASEHDVRRGREFRLWQGLALLGLATVLVAAGFGAGIGTMWYLGPQVRSAVATLAPQAVRSATQESTEERFSLLEETWDILEGEFHDPEALDERKMIHGAAEGLTSALDDPYTLFVEPLRAAIMEEDMRGSFEGIGATVSMVEGKLVIVSPLPDSPALKAGIQPGDIILAVNDEPLEGKTYLEAISMIRGPRGTVVRLRVQREGVAEPFIVPVTREKVELPIIESRLLEEGIAYLSLREFNAVSETRLHTALRELLRGDPTGLILDLRGNPGGFLPNSVDIASEFLPKGALVVSEKERDKPMKEHRVKRTGIAARVPLVVLVNRSSASASEIVAGAIRDHQRGALIGEQTFGKGSVQVVHKLQDGSSLRVTVAKWYLPNGDNLDGKGILPDIEVALTPEDISKGNDTQLERAVAYLLGGE